MSGEISAMALIAGVAEGKSMRKASVTPLWCVPFSYMVMLGSEEFQQARCLKQNNILYYISYRELCCML